MITIPTVDAQTSKLIIPTHEDTSVDQEYPDTNKIMAFVLEGREGMPFDSFDKWVFLTSGWADKSKSIDDQERENIQVYQTLAYMKFDLIKIQTTNVFDKVETEAFVELMIQELKGDASSALVTIFPCYDNSWDKSLGWSDEICIPPTNGEDSIVINEKDLPNRFTFDVTNSINNATKFVDEITFVVSSMPMQDADILEIEKKLQGEAFSSAQIKIWSSELNEYGDGAVPTLIVHQNIQSSSLSTGIDYFLVTILPTLAVIIPIGIWIYNKGRKSANIKK